MCAEYALRGNQKKIEKALARSINNHLGVTDFEQDVRLTNRAPALEMKDGKFLLTKKLFPVRPFPNARLSGSESEDDNDEEQIRRIYDRRTWRTGFLESPLLIPMTGFREPVYWGDKIGSVMEFKIPDTDVFFAAAIAIKPQTPPGDFGEAFSLLTHTATPQMLKYHHRLLVLFENEAAAEWLENDFENDPEKRLEFALKNRFTEKLEVTEQRKMAKGWEKRVDLQTGKRDHELAYVSTLDKEGVRG